MRSRPSTPWPGPSLAFSTRLAGFLAVAVILVASASRPAPGASYRVARGAIRSGGFVARSSDFTVRGNIEPLGGGLQYGTHYRVGGGLGPAPGSSRTVGVPAPGTLSRFVVLPSRPNPFTHSTTIRFYTPAAARGTLLVHDVAGRLIERADVRANGPGWSTATWDGHDQTGAVAPAGVYFIDFRINQATYRSRVARVR